MNHLCPLVVSLTVSKAASRTMVDGWSSGTGTGTYFPALASARSMLQQTNKRKNKQTLNKQTLEKQTVEQP